MNHQFKKIMTAMTMAYFMSGLCAAQADEVEARPYRPTVSNPADLSAPGWLELEFGAQRTKRGEDKWRDSFPVLAKLALSENWGILLGGEMGIRRTDSSEQIFNGYGDTTVTLKHRMPTATEGTAFGVELGYKSPSASTDVGGSGKSDTILNGIFSTEIAGNGIDLNAGVTEVGGVEAGVDTYSYSWALAAGRSVTEQWGAFLEVSGTQQRGKPTKAQYMAGLTYTVNKRVVLDAGIARGMTADSLDSMVFAGATVLAGKLW